MHIPTAALPPVFQPVYLVELFDPKTGELVNADISGNAVVAIQSGIEHAHLFKDTPVTGVDVQASSAGSEEGIEGMALFIGEDADKLLVCISRYELKNEKCTPNTELSLALRTSKPGELKNAIAAALMNHLN